MLESETEQRLMSLCFVSTVQHLQEMSNDGKQVNWSDSFYSYGQKSLFNTI